MRDLHPAPAADHAILEHRHLGKGAVNVQFDDSHNPTPSVLVDETGAGGQHDTYGSALAAHPGKSQGAAKKLTRARGSWSSERACPHSACSRCPCRAIRLRPRQVAGIINTFTDITEQETAKTEMLQAKEQAELANRTKSSTWPI